MSGRGDGDRFLGFGLTFLAIYFVPSPTGRRKWAPVPAAVCAVLGLGLIVSSGNELWLVYLGPIVLILVGAYLLYRAYRRGRTPSPRL